MKTIALATFAAGALTAALGLAGTAAAFPGDGSAEDTVSGLKADSFIVELNGSTNNQPLSRCSVLGMHPLLSNLAGLSTAEKRNTVVLVDISCPSH